MTQSCANHQDAPAMYVCDWCMKALCTDCVDVKQFGIGEVASCRCGGRCVPIDKPSSPEPKPDKRQSQIHRVPKITVSKEGWIPNGFTYPFKGQGLALMIVGTIVFSILSFICSVSVFGYIGLFIIGGYLCAYYQRIIQTSSDGEGELPNWPDFTDFFADIVAPFFQILGCFVLCLAPAFAYKIFLSQLNFDPIFLILLIAGLLFLPMSLISVSLAESIMAFNPVILIPSIVKVIKDYAVIVVVLGISAVFSTMAETILTEAIPLLGRVLGWFVSFYFATVQCRLMGLLYFRNQDKLDWF